MPPSGLRQLHGSRCPAAQIFCLILLTCPTRFCYAVSVARTGTGGVEPLRAQKEVRTQNQKSENGGGPPPNMKEGAPKSAERTLRAGYRI